MAASNTSFAGCYRSQNVVVNGSEGNPSKPARQQIADNGTNSFTWCVWNESKANGTSTSISNGTSNGGAIFMYGLSSGTLSVKFCSFNDCYAYYAGGGILCRSIYSINIENNSFNACTAKNYRGGGIHAYDITSCVRISGCEFQKCNASNRGGGLYLDYFNVSGSACIGTENGNGESACVFECSFTSCTLSSTSGGGMFCYNVPSAFKMRSLQFISCSAVSYGGGLYFYTSQTTAPANNIYCYFLFFHDCSCSNSTPYGHDVYFQDYYNLFSSNNPFYESYTTNNNDTRVCYRYVQSSSWTYQHTEKKGWLKDKTIYVGVSGDDSSNLCGMSESAPCKTVGHAVGSSMAQLSSTITVLGGRHVSEEKTISVGEKEIIITGKGKAVSVVGTNSLSISSTTSSVRRVTVGVEIIMLAEITANPRSEGSYSIKSSVFVLVLPQLPITAFEVKKQNSATAHRLHAAPLPIAVSIAPIPFPAVLAHPGTRIIEKFFCCKTSPAAPCSTTLAD